jgi:glutamate racemase
LESHKAVALLDSGVGGLTVVKEIRRLLPRENIVYFGDTARMPYGPRSPEEVRGYVFEIIDFLETQEIKAIIVACNSAAAAGLHLYQEKVALPLLGVIEPGVRAALKQTKNHKIGVIGTAGTISSGAYQKVVQRLAPEVELTGVSCPLFVLIVENGLVGTPEAFAVAEEYLKPLKKAGVDTLILGCTHYPLISDVIQQVMGDKVRLISSAEETARETKQILEERNLLNRNDPGPARQRYFVSGPASPFSKMAARLLEGEVRAYQVILSL